MTTTTFTDGSTVIVASWLQDVNDHVYTNGVTLTGSQTLTNKTLTSPTINTPTITTPSVSNPTLTGTITGTGTHTQVVSSGAITSSSATAGLGYATGAGGTVTQATSKSTGVTLNKVCGEITMNNAALGQASEVSFTVTNSACAANDVVIVNHASAGTAGAYTVHAHSIAAGSFGIMVGNMSGGSLSEAIVLKFAIIKGVAA